MNHVFPSLLLMGTWLCAQAPQPTRDPSAPRLTLAPAEALPENFQLTLTIADKDARPVELSVLVASTQFQATLGNQGGVQLSGTLTIDPTGVLIISNVIGWETPVPGAKDTVQYRSSNAQGIVRLKPGEEMEVIRAGPRMARLSVQKISPTKAK